MPISFVDVATTNPPGANATANINLPARLATDVLLLQCTINKATTIVTPPDGFTHLVTLTETALTSAYFYRVATGLGDIDPATTWAVSGQNVCICSSYRGVDNASPFIDTKSTIHAGSSSTAHPIPAMSNTDPNAWAVFMGGARQVPTPFSWTPPGGMFERADLEVGAANTTNVASTLADSNGAVAVGSLTYTGQTSAASPQATTWGAILKPAAGGPPPIDMSRFFQFM